MSLLADIRATSSLRPSFLGREYRSGLGCVQSQDPGGYRVRDPVLPSPQMEVIASAYLPTLSVSRLSHVRCLFLHWYVGKLERPVPCV